jgi:hypothetical protein
MSAKTANHDELRDRIAIAAMQAWLSRAAFDQGAEDMMHKAGITNPDDKERFIARVAYSMADHMLAVRGEGREAMP